MASVDDRIVRIEFDNANFERNVATTLKTIAELNKAMKFDGAKASLGSLSTAAGSFDGSHIISSIERISSKFSALGAIGFSAIQSMTQGVLGFAKKTGQDILEPIIGGGRTRATNIENAKFQFRGLGIDVNKAMDSSLKAVKGTSFGLDEAAKAAAQFGASGIDAGDQMTSSLRAIAGSAAMTNTSFSEMADIFTSSAAAGKVNNQDLAQFATRGLNAAAAVGKVMGKSETQIHEMAKNGELDFKTFSDAMDQAFGKHATEANQTFTGALANMHAALARVGAAFLGPKMEQQRQVFNALTPVIDNVNEALKPLFNTLLGIGQLGTNKLVKSLKGLNLDRFKLSIGIVSPAILTSFKALMQVVNTIKTAFRDIFPKSSRSLLVDIALGFQKLANAMILGTGTIGKLRRIFDGLFSILKIGWTIVKEGVKFIGNLVKQFTNLGSGSLLESIAKVGDFFTNLQKGLTKSGGVAKFFNNLSKYAATAVAYISKLGSKLADFFGGAKKGSTDAASKGIKGLGDGLSRLTSVSRRIGNIWRPFEAALQKIVPILDTVWVAIKNWFADLGKKIAAQLGPGDFNSVLDAINIGLLGGIAGLIAKFLKGGFKVDLTGGLADKIGATFDQLTNTMKSMQTQIKAEALKKIAIAIGILTASVVVLSMIDSAKLTKALTAMAVGFGELMGSFAILNKISSGTKGSVDFGVMALGLNALATAILILSLAVKVLSDLKWNELLRGLTGVAAMLVIIAAASIPLSANSEGMISAGLGITAVAIALDILAGAVKKFSKLSWKDMAKGLVGVVGALGAIALAMQLMPSNMILQSVALLAISVAMNALYLAVKDFSKLSWKEMGKGLTGLAGSLVVIGLAMQTMPPDMIATSAALILVGIALNIIAKAMKKMGDFSWKEIGKGLVTMAGALLILGIACSAMQSSIPGALAIFIVAEALVVLAKALGAFVKIKFSDLIHALEGIAISLGVFALAAALMEPLLPALLGLGAALTLLGFSFILFGAAAYLAAKAFETIANVGDKGAKTITASLRAIGQAIPELAVGLAQGLIDFVLVIAKAAPVIVMALGQLLSKMLDTMILIIPKFLNLISILLTGMLNLIKQKTPEFVITGFFVLISFLKGLRDNIEQVTTLVLEIILKFLDTINKNMPQIVASGVALLLNFLSGIANNLALIAGVVAQLIVTFIGDLAKHYGEIISAGLSLLLQFLSGIIRNLVLIVNTATTMIVTLVGAIARNLNRVVTAGANAIISFINGIASNLNRVVSAGANAIISFVNGMASNVNRVVTAGANAIISFINGVGSNLNRIVTAGTNVVISFINGISSNSVRLANAGADAIVSFVNGLAGAIESHRGALEGAGARLAIAVADGFTGGLAGKAAGMAKSVTDGIGGAIAAGAHALGINSPSKVFWAFGESAAEGFSLALDKDTSIESSTVNIITRSTEAFQNALGVMTNAIGDVTEFNPTITPVLDLTKFSSDAQKINDYIQTSQTLSPGYSLNQARLIAGSTNAQQTPSSDSTTAQSGEVSFEQNIYAPTQLSTSDIYKQTRNQITMAKEELSIP